MKRTTILIGAALAAIPSQTVCGIPRAEAQDGRAQRIGSVSARAPRSTVTLGQNETTVELTGGVSIQTDTGDILRAQRVVLQVGPMPDPGRPGRNRTDVRKATAVGDVYIKHVTTETTREGEAFRRVITGTASRGELDRVTQGIALLQGVRVQSTDTLVRGDRQIATYDLQNVSAAKLNLRTELVSADAPEGQRMRILVRQRIEPRQGAPFWRVVNGATRHAEMDQASNLATLTGEVDISVDEPAATYTWKNAATAKIDMNTQKVEANAADGQQMNVDVQFKMP